MQLQLRDGRGGKLDDPRFQMRVVGKGPHAEAATVLFRKTCERLRFGELDEDTGELFPDVADVGDLGSLEKEFFQTPDGNEIPVCNTCHGFILRPAMIPDTGHCLLEGMQCSDSACESHDE